MAEIDRMADARADSGRDEALIMVSAANFGQAS
jgi:hypothetical protein